jgi:hypothetical protein
MIMKKLIVLTIVCCLSIVVIGHAQKKPKNYLNLNAGVGLLPTFLKDGGKAVLHPLSFTADYKLRSNFSMGLSIGHSVTRTAEQAFVDGSMAQWNNHFTAIGIRSGAYSNLIADRWHFYGGLSIGYSISEIEMLQGEAKKARQEMGVDQSGGKLFYTAYMGTRYSITPHLGAFAEVSLGISLVSIGASVSVW